MFNIIKRHIFVISVFITLCVCIFDAVYCYANGQAIASAHLDGHYNSALINIFIAALLSVIFVVRFLITKQLRIKWFVIPIIFIVFAPIHLYIGSLFNCCVGG